MPPDSGSHVSGPAGLRERAARAGLLAALALGGCAAFFQAPEVRVVGLRVVSLGVTSGTAELALEIWNENRSSLEVRGVRYRLDVRGPDDAEEGSSEWMRLGEGYHRSKTVVGAGDTTRVRIEVPFQYDAVGAAVRAFLRDGEVRYRLDGELRINGALGEYQVPLRTTGAVSP